MPSRELILPRGHVLATLYAEHERLLAFLAELDERMADVAAGDAATARRAVEAIVGLARLFVGAEPHHQREERVLFPRLEALGLFGPPRRLRFEHEELRALKARLLELGLEAERARSSGAHARALLGVGTSLAHLLREHIAREDEVLYPMSFEVVDPAFWDAMKAECDRIGYCSFTPPA